MRKPEDAEVMFGTGDVDPLTYGGGVVYYDSELEIFVYEFWDEPTDENGREVDPEGHTYTVWRCGVPADVCAEFDWADWPGVSEAMGHDCQFDTTGTLRESVLCLEDLAGYYGPENLDSYPCQFTHEELLARWPHLA